MVIIIKSSVNKMVIERGDIMNLALLRERNKMTLQDVANKIGKSKQCYWNYEKGIRQIPLKVAIILADIFHVTTEEIFIYSQSNHNVNK